MAKSKAVWLARHRRIGSLWNQLKIVGPAVVLIVAGFVLAYQFVEPAPPRRLVIAAGPADGAYYAFAERYAKRFAREGIDLVPRATAGSAENLALLADPDSGVHVAFVQGGIGTRAEHPSFVSLGSLYYEPLWVFTRGAARLRRLSDLVGRRIAVGVPGSGTRPVALRLLGDNGVNARNATLLDLAATDAAAALRAGRIDAAMFVISADTAIVRDLLAAPGIGAMSFGRADAYVRRYRFLSAVVLPEGTLDLARDLPPQDVRLLAPSATLVANDLLHPALAGLLLQTARAVHRGGGLLERPGEFPSPHHVTFPLSDEARRFYDSGPPLLQRYLPFWAANLANRLKIMLLPLVTLLYPVFKLLPPIYSWRMNGRINRWYKVLQALDDRINTGEATVKESLLELDRIEHEVRRLSIPSGYADRVYELRLHIDMLHRRLQAGPERTVPV